jgi:hypothetical protein
VEVHTRMTRAHARPVIVTALIALLAALVPAGMASAQAVPDARDTSNVCQPPFTSTFTDIAGSAHEENVLCMADYGLTVGTGDGTTYSPRRFVTRAQMASFIARWIEFYIQEDLGDEGFELDERDERFDDVPADFEHASNIHKLAEIGVTQGTRASDGQSFAPQAPVTRAQMASFISRASSYIGEGEAIPETQPPRTDDDFFPDDDGSVHEDSINALADVGIVEGFRDGNYRPSDTVFRDQMASFVMRAYDWAVEVELGQPVGPADATIVSAEIDTREVGVEDPAISEGDEWVIVFSEDMDTSETGAIIELETDDGDVVVECLAEGAAPGDDTDAAAACAYDDDTSFRVEITQEDALGAEYPALITALDGLTTAEGMGVDVEGSAAANRTIGAEFGPEPPELVPFTAFVETGSLEIGDSEFEFPACPDGEPAEEGDECIVFEGGLDLEEGTHTIPAEGVSFPELILDTGVADVAINFAAPGGASGVFDGATGEITFDTELQVLLDVGANGTDNCRLDVDLEGTTGTSGAATGSAFDATDGRATIVEGEFAVPASTPITGGDAATCGLVDGFLELPSPSGDNLLTFNMLFVTD